MKRIYYVLSLIVLLTGMSMGVKAQSWDFTQTPEADVTALQADTRNWTFTETSNRYESKNEINGAITANGSELEMTKGLTVAAAANKIRIDVNNRLQLAGKNIPLTTPTLKKGQVVTVVFASTGATAVTFDALTNLSGTSGFTAADKGTTQTGTGTVLQDGTVSFKCTGGSVNVFSIKVEGDGEQGSGVSGDDYSTTSNTNVNQAILTLSDNSRKYYNTASVRSIDFDGSKVTVNQAAGSYTFDGNVAGISFRKAEGQSGEIVNPEGAVKIVEAKGWLESAYVKFDLFEGAKTYNVYVKGGQYSEYTKIDDQLVRNYGTYGRADVVGLKAATDYAIKVIPVKEDKTELTDKASEATNIIVKNYSREGFAFLNGYTPGAYNSDGTLKANAKVFYVTKNTAKTISTTVAGAETNPCVGIQAIIEGYEKGGDKTPIAFRFIGLVTKDDLDAVGSKEEGIQVKGKKADSELNLTFEGIGDDATIKGFGFLVRNSKSVEFRNFGIMRCMDDGISMDTDNSNIWVHHMDIFYGPNGGGDHAKGDGSVDVKSDSKYVTVSYNHFWDTGKTNMFGMKSESGPNYISYDHNWFDHSDSRHPRVRTMSVHVWNNYFDNVAKYGVGATSGASVFVENNYFLKTKKPILASLQGTDGLGSGTFSGENGGMIKAYGNYFDRTAAHFSYYTQANPSAKGYDAYETATRDEQVPETEKTLVGGTTYNNFDTNASLMYSYEAVAAEEVPGLVTGYYGAGRINHGDFTYTFSDNVGSDDTDSAYDSTLGGLLDNYKSPLVGIFGDENASGGGEEPGGDQPGGDTPAPEGTILGTFDGSPSNSMFTVGGNYGDGKITYNGTSLKKGVKLDSKGSITFTPAKNYNMTLVLATAKSGRDVKVNGETTTVSGTENTEGAYYELQPIAITAGTQYVLTKGSAESIVMVVKLEPIE
jgi:pectate lyase